VVVMPTNLALDDDLLDEALRVGGRRSKRETVNEALAEYIQRRKRRGFTRLFGTIDFRPDWDYKKARRRS
jgi:Arc/MetJ family transcription regulator